MSHETCFDLYFKGGKCCNVSARSARLTIDNLHLTNVHHWQAPAAEDVAEAEEPAKEQAADGMSLGHGCPGYTSVKGVVAVLRSQCCEVVDAQITKLPLGLDIAA